MASRAAKVSSSELIGFSLLALALAVVMFAGKNSASSAMPIPIGTPLPEMWAEGWLNAETIPSRQSLSDKVVVVDCWATWCPPCRAAIPKLAKMYEKYEPLGVEFIGITPESTQEKKNVSDFVSSMDGFDWPVGYGASPTIDMLGVRLFPTVIVFNREGLATWSSTRLRGLEGALDQALANFP